MSQSLSSRTCVSLVPNPWTNRQRRSTDSVGYASSSSSTRTFWPTTPGGRKRRGRDEHHMQNQQSSTILQLKGGRLTDGKRTGAESEQNFSFKKMKLVINVLPSTHFVSSCKLRSTALTHRNAFKTRLWTRTRKRQ